MANLGKLIVELSLDSDKFEQTLAETKKSVQSSVKEIEQNLKFKKISIKVDDSALNKLNKHLDKKKEHIDNLNNHLKQTPLTVFVNDKALTDLSHKLAGLKRQKNTIQIDLNIKENKTAKSSQKSSTGTSSKTDGKETGEQFLEGVGTGIVGIDSVGKIAGKKFKKAVETELGIRSPATSGIDAGKKYVEGVEIGIQNELPRIKKAGKKIKEVLAKEVSIETVVSAEIVNQSSTPKTKTSKTKNTKNPAVASTSQSPSNVIQQIETLKKQQQEYFNQIQLQTISIEQYNAFIEQLHKELDSLKAFATAEQKTKITAAKSQFTKSKTKAKNISQPPQKQTSNKKSNPLSSSSAILAQQEKSLVDFQEEALKLIDSNDMAGFSKLMVNYEKLANNTFASVDKLIKNMKSPEEANLISKVIENLNRKYSESKTLLLQRLQIKIAPPQQVNQDKVAGSEIKTAASNVSKAIDITDDEILAIIEDLDTQLGTENYLPIFHLQDKLNINKKELEKALYRLQKANKIDLDSLSEYSAYTPEQISAGIPQTADGPLFFIQSLQKKIQETATPNFTEPLISEAKKVLETTISDDEILETIRNLDKELGTENYLPIFHLRDKLKHIRREELDAALFRLQKADKLDLGTIQESSQYTAEQLDAGIPTGFWNQWFFLTQPDKPVGTDVDNPLNTDEKDFQNPELTKPKKEKKPKAKKQSANTGKSKKKNQSTSYEEIKEDISAAAAASLNLSEESSALLAEYEKQSKEIQEAGLKLLKSKNFSEFKNVFIKYKEILNININALNELQNKAKNIGAAAEELNQVVDAINKMQQSYNQTSETLKENYQKIKQESAETVKKTVQPPKIKEEKIPEAPKTKAKKTATTPKKSKQAEVEPTYDQFKKDALEAYRQYNIGADKTGGGGMSIHELITELPQNRYSKEQVHKFLADMQGDDYFRLYQGSNLTPDEQNAAINSSGLTRTHLSLESEHLGMLKRQSFEEISKKSQHSYETFVNDIVSLFSELDTQQGNDGLVAIYELRRQLEAGKYSREEFDAFLTKMVQDDYFNSVAGELIDPSKPATAPNKHYKTLPPDIRRDSLQLEGTSLKTLVTPSQKFDEVKVSDAANLKNTGKEVVKGMKSGVADMDKVGKEAGKNFRKGVQSELGIKSPSTVAIDIGEKFIQGLVIGLKNKIPELNNFVKNVVLSFKNTILKSNNSSENLISSDKNLLKNLIPKVTPAHIFNNFKSIGTSVSEGFLAGATNLRKGFEPVGNIFKSMVTKVKSVLKISSPSKIMESIGLDFGKGFENGAIASLVYSSHKISEQYKKTINKLISNPATSAAQRQQLIAQRDVIDKQLQAFAQKYKSGGFADEKEAMKEVGKIFADSIKAGKSQGLDVRQIVADAKQQFETAQKPLMEQLFDSFKGLFSFDSQDGSIGGIAKMVQSLAPLFLAVGGAIFVAVAQFEKFVQLFQKFEPMQKRLEFTSGSKQGAIIETDYALQAAKQLGVPAESAIDAYGKIAAAAKGTKMEGKGAKELFEGISQSIAAMGLGTADASLIFMAYTQMLSKGKISMEELRQQLGERFPPAMQIFAKALGVSVAEVSELSKQGALLSEEVLPKVAKVLKTDFKGSSDTGDNFTVALVKLENIATEISIKIINAFSGILAGITGVVTGFAQLISNSFDLALKAVGSFFIGAAALMTAGLAFLLKSTPVVAWAATFVGLLTSGITPLITSVFSIAAPHIIAGIASMFAERNPFQIIADSFKNLMAMIVTTVNQVKKQFTGEGILSVIIGKEASSNPFQSLIESLANLFKMIPSGVLEFIALTLVLGQIRSLATQLAGPVLTALSGAFTIFKAALSSVAQSATNLPQMLANVGKAAKSLGSLLAQAALAIGILLLSKSDFSNPVQQSMDKMASAINGSLNSITNTIDGMNKSLQNTSNISSNVGTSIKSIADSIPSKGLQLDILFALGFKTKGYTTDDFVKNVNKALRGEISEEDLGALEKIKYKEVLRGRQAEASGDAMRTPIGGSQTANKKLTNNQKAIIQQYGLTGLVADTDYDIALGTQQVLENFENLDKNLKGFKTKAKDIGLTEETKSKLLSNPAVKKSIEDANRINAEIMALSLQRAKISSSKKPEDIKKVAEIDKEIKAKTDRFKEKTKGLDDIKDQVAVMEETVKQFESSVDSIPEAVRPKYRKLVEELKAGAEEAKKIVSQNLPTNPLESIYQKTVTALNRFQSAYEKFSAAIGRTSSMRSERIYSSGANLGDINNATMQSGIISGEQRVRGLSRILTMRKASLETLSLIPQTLLTTDVKDQIKELRDQVQSDAGELAAGKAEVAKSKYDLQQSLKEQQKQVDDYVQATTREIEDIGIEVKKATQEIESSNFSSKINQALTGLADDEFTQYVDGLASLLMQARQTAMDDLDAKKQQITFRNRIEDVQSEAEDLIKTLPTGKNLIGVVEDIEQDMMNAFSVSSRELEGLINTAKQQAAGLTTQMGETNKQSVEINKNTQQFQENIVNATTSITNMNIGLERTAELLSQSANNASQINLNQSNQSVVPSPSSPNPFTLDFGVPLPPAPSNNTTPPPNNTSGNPPSSVSGFVHPHPNRGTTVSGGHFGDPRPSRRHAGRDFAGRIGEPIVSSLPGIVKIAETQRGYGKVIYIEHTTPDNKKLETRYAHLSEMLVRVGEIVQAGQQIGKLGNTGIGSGPHLHFEIRVNGQAIDPTPFITGQTPISAVVPSAPARAGSTSAANTTAVNTGAVAQSAKERENAIKQQQEIDKKRAEATKLQKQADLTRKFTSFFSTDFTDKIDDKTIQNLQELSNLYKILGNQNIGYDISESRIAYIANISKLQRFIRDTDENIEQINKKFVFDKKGQIQGLKGFDKLRDEINKTYKDDEKTRKQYLFTLKQQEQSAIAAYKDQLENLKIAKRINTTFSDELKKRLDVNRLVENELKLLQERRDKMQVYNAILDAKIRIAQQQKELNSFPVSLDTTKTPSMINEEYAAFFFEEKSKDLNIDELGLTFPATIGGATSNELMLKEMDKLEDFLPLLASLPDLEFERRNQQIEDKFNSDKELALKELGLDANTEKYNNTVKQLEEIRNEELRLSKQKLNLDKANETKTEIDKEYEKKDLMNSVDYDFSKSEFASRRYEIEKATALREAQINASVLLNEEERTKLVKKNQEMQAKLMGDLTKDIKQIAIAMKQETAQIRLNIYRDKGGNQFQINAEQRRMDEERLEKEKQGELDKAKREKEGGDITDEEYKDRTKEIEERYKAKLEESKNAAKDVVSTIRQMVRESLINDLSAGLTDVIMGVQKLDDVLNNLAKNMLSGLINMAIKSLMQSLVGAGGILDSLFKSIGGIFGGNSGGEVPSANDGGEVSSQYKGGVIKNYAGGGIIQSLNEAITREKAANGGITPVVAVLTPGERVLSVADNAKFQSMGLDKVIKNNNIESVMNYAMGGNVSNSELKVRNIMNFASGGVIPPSPGIGNINQPTTNTTVNVPITIESQDGDKSPSIDPNAMQNAIKTAVIVEIQRQQRQGGILKR